MGAPAGDWGASPNADPAATFAAATTHHAPRRAKINRTELADMTAQLAIMTRSGVDITTALHSLARQCRRPALAGVLTDVRDAVVGGATFSQALAQYEHAFGPSYVATVSAGEASGKMSHVLGQLAQLQRSELRMARTVRSLMSYPVLLASVSSLVIAALILFVLPQFADIFEQYETPLPVLTQILIGFAAELRVRWFLYLPLAMMAVSVLAAVKFSAAGRRIWDWATVHAWLIRDVSRTLLVGRACRLIGLMIESGVPVLQSLRLARQAIGNSLYVELFAQLEDEVINGRGLATALNAAEIVPPSASEMIATAERSGKLGEVTRLVGEHFEEEGEAKLRQIVAVLEPIITVGMGVIVAIVVLAVMLPMFDLATFAQRGS